MTNKTSPDKLAYIKKWQRDNKDKKAQHMRTYYEKNRERLKQKERDKTRRVRIENKERIFMRELEEMDDDDLISCLFMNLHIGGMNMRGIINEIANQDEQQIRETFMRFYRRFESEEEREGVKEALKNRLI